MNGTWALSPGLGPAESLTHAQDSAEGAEDGVRISALEAPAVRGSGWKPPENFWGRHPVIMEKALFAINQRNSSS